MSREIPLSDIPANDHKLYFDGGVGIWKIKGTDGVYETFFTDSLQFRIPGGKHVPRERDNNIVFVKGFPSTLPTAINWPLSSNFYMAISMVRVANKTSKRAASQQTVEPHFHYDIHDNTRKKIAQWVSSGFTDSFFKEHFPPIMEHIFNNKIVYPTIQEALAIFNKGTAFSVAISSDTVLYPNPQRDVVDIFFNGFPIGEVGINKLYKMRTSEELIESSMKELTERT